MAIAMRPNTITPERVAERRVDNEWFGGPHSLSPVRQKAPPDVGQGSAATDLLLNGAPTGQTEGDRQDSAPTASCPDGRGLTGWTHWVRLRIRRLEFRVPPSALESPGESIQRAPRVVRYLVGNPAGERDALGCTGSDAGASAGARPGDPRLIVYIGRDAMTMPMRYAETHGSSARRAGECNRAHLVLIKT